MLYVSQLQKKQVWDAWGQPVGYCKDVLVGDVDQPFPPLRALALRNGGSAPEFVAAEQVSGLYPSIILTVPRADVKAFSPRGDELWLVDRVLDRQIVDTDGRRVVRVNDLQIARVRGHRPFGLTAQVFAAGLVIGQFTRYLRGLPVDTDLTLNILTSELTCLEPAVGSHPALCPQ